MKKLYTYIVLIVLCTSCSNTIRNDYHHLKSPLGDKCITVINREYLFHGFNKKEPAGIFIFYGKYVKGDTLPNKYLKVDFYDDFCSIQWTEPIVFSYDHISENKIDSNNMIIVNDAKLFDALASKKKLIYGKNVEHFYLDNIFNNKIESLRKRRREEN